MSRGPGARDDAVPDEASRDEEVELYGRHFTLRFAARPDLQRVEVEILQGRGAVAQPYVCVPVRARSRPEARDRAVEVLQNHAGLERYLGLVGQTVDVLAPESRLVVSESAAEIRIDLTGPRRLQTPLVLVRDDALDPERTDQELLAFIRAHLDAYLEPG